MDNILSISDKVNKDVVVYLSMCFGNPYGDPWNLDIVNEWVFKLSKMGVNTISLSDTIGSSNTESISSIFESVLKIIIISNLEHIFTQTLKLHTIRLKVHLMPDADDLME